MTVHLQIPGSIANSVRLLADLVTTRNIPRHYGDAELDQDLDYARGQ